MTARNPFEYVTQINTGKKNPMRGSEDDALAEKEYNPFLTNRALSYHYDTIEFANDMNINYHLDKRPQFEYLLNSVRKGKRHKPWFKNEPSEIINAICSVYGCNKSVANQYLKILTNDHLKAILKTRETGGSSK